MSDIVMPKLSDTMTEGRLVSWKKRVGEEVRRGDVIAEVETDKANMELEAFTSGVLLEIRVQPGEMAQVGTVIAVIGKPEEKGAQPAQPAAQPKPEPEPAAQPQPEAAPQAAPAAEAGKEAAPEPPPAATKQPAGAAGEAEVKQATAKPGGEGESQAPAAPLAEVGEAQAPVQPGEGGKTEAPPQPGPAAPPAGAPGEGGEIRERAAPVVRRRAREMGVDLSQVKGSGPEGRILMQDLESHGAAGGAGKPATAAATPSAAAPAAAPSAAPKGGGETKPLPRLRAAVAKIVTESWDTIPHFTVTMDIVMDDAESVRQQLKQTGKPVTVNDLIVKGVALALEKFPNMNAAFTPEGMRLRNEINVGVAVGVRDGVLIPVIKGCEHLSLLEIAQQSRKLVERARAGSLSEQDMSGGTFSVSNMGMYGVAQFTAIIYPHQSGVLAVGGVTDTVVMRCGVPASAKVMKVTLSADHRLIDGAYAAEFLVEFKAIMEAPVRLLISGG